MSNDSNEARISIATVEEFRLQEQRIIQRINATPNGGLLFACDPLRLLAEVGVELQPQLRHTLEVEWNVVGGAPSAAAYNAVRMGRVDSSVKVVVEGILKR